MRLCRFDTPNRSKFIIFQGEYKGPKNKILISGAPKSIEPGFQAYTVIWLDHAIDRTIFLLDSIGQ